MIAPQDLPAAVLKLRETLLATRFDTEGARSRREAVGEVKRLLHERVVAPMMSEAMEAPRATERAIGLGTAQLVETFLTESVLVNARVTKALSDRGMAGVSVLPLEEIRALLGMGDRVAKFCRELDRCRQSTGNVIQVTALPQPKPLALTDSG